MLLCFKDIYKFICGYETIPADIEKVLFWIYNKTLSEI